MHPYEYIPPADHFWSRLLKKACVAFGLKNVQPDPLISFDYCDRRISSLPIGWPEYYSRDEGFNASADGCHIHANRWALTVSKQPDVSLQSPDSDFSWIDVQTIASSLLPHVSDEEVSLAVRQLSILLKKANWVERSGPSHGSYYKLAHQSWRGDPARAFLERSDRSEPRAFRSFQLFPSAGWAIEIAQGREFSPVQGELLTWHYRTRKVRSDYEFTNDEEQEPPLVPIPLKQRLVRSIDERPSLTWGLRRPRGAP